MCLNNIKYSRHSNSIFQVLCTRAVQYQLTIPLLSFQSMVDYSHMFLFRVVNITPPLKWALTTPESCWSNFILKFQLAEPSRTIGWVEKCEVSKRKTIFLIIFTGNKFFETVGCLYLVNFYSLFLSECVTITKSPDPFCYILGLKFIAVPTSKTTDIGRGDAYSFETLSGWILDNSTGFFVEVSFKKNEVFIFT